MQRLADVRVFAYITARPDWMRNATFWAERAREIEDKISDTLHEKLMARFVDRRAAHLTRRLEALERTDGERLLSAVTAKGMVLVEGHPVGHIEGFTFHPDAASRGEEKRFLIRAARRALREEMPRRILRAEQAEDDAFTLDGQHILWEGAPIARLRKGAVLLRPAVEILPSEFLDGAARERLRLRLASFVNARVTAALGPLLHALAAPAPELRGLMHRLGEAAGILAEPAISPALRHKLKGKGIEAGQFAIYLPAVLKPRAAAMRALLGAVWQDRAAPELPAPGVVCAARLPGWDDGLALAHGWLGAGPVMLRLDIAERVARELNHLMRNGPVPVPPGLCSRMSLRPEILPAVLNRLGFRVIPAPTLAPDAFGPPPPPMLSRCKTTRGPRSGAASRPPEVRPDHPFAALKVLRDHPRRAVS
jgi:ATP-dependent RNA helicase SUPV3L1/SUV3